MSIPGFGNIAYVDVESLDDGRFLILETKGRDTEKDQTKRRFLDEWVRGVNEHGGFGEWSWAVSRHPGEVRDVLQA